MRYANGILQVSMNPQEADLTGEEIKALFHETIEGDISFLDEDREKVARDTSIFYVKPKVVVYPKHAQDIATILTQIGRAHV